MCLLVTPSFMRATKKLHPSQKADLDEAVRIVGINPEMGEANMVGALNHEWLPRAPQWPTD